MDGCYMQPLIIGEPYVCNDFASWNRLEVLHLAFVGI